MIRNQIKLLDRYIGSNTLLGVLLVLAVLVILFSFFELLAQLNDIGKGNFRLADAFVYTALTIPKRAVDLMPVSALLGSVVALGMMADRNELAAMQAAGMSAQRISTSVIVSGIILMGTALLVAEFIAPPLDQHARIRRSRAVRGKTVMISKTGFWIRQGRSFIHVGQTLSPDRAADIEIYKTDESGRFKQFIYAKNAEILNGNNWRLTDVEQKIISGDIITHQQLADYRLNAFLSRDQMQILKLPPDSLALTDLYAYIRSLKKRQQNVEAHDLAFWQKICQPITTSIMVLLSLTFIFGPTRMKSAGRRIAGGVLVGTLFYLTNQILGHLGLLLNIPPMLTTLTPVALILFVALRLLRRVY